MLTRTIRSAVLTAAVLLCSAVPALVPAYAAAPADGGPGWTVAPASSGGTRPSAGGRPYFYLEGAPGTVLEDALTLTNPGKKPVTVRLRGAEAYHTPAGGSALRATDTTWITPAARSVELPARTSARVPFSVTVPATAEPGDHPAAIVAAAGGRETGVRVRLRVSGPTLSALTVEDVRVDKGPGLIRYTLVNRGNTALTPHLDVRAGGLIGGDHRIAGRTLPVELLPGRRVSLTEKWPHPPALGAAAVHLVVTAGGGARSTGTASAVFVPRWWPAGLLVPALACAGLWSLRRRHARRPGTGAGPGPYDGEGAEGSDRADAGDSGSTGSGKSPGGTGDPGGSTDSEPATAGAAT
ncbi:COG1470 family protein [Streptomyces sp. NBC_00388]|uniref:COG1470 family protein n=1 Tax=Streptomyces sp. NBC_00388 TaxID=2975735 RepID=UPI002E1F9EC1